MSNDCKRCGKCCSNLYLMDCVDISIHTRTFMFNKRCKFLTNNNLCSIYDRKPSMCNNWECEVFYNKRKSLYCDNLCVACLVCDVLCKNLSLIDRIKVSVHTKSIMFSKSCKFIGPDGLCMTHDNRPRMCGNKCEGEFNESR